MNAEIDETTVKEIVRAQFQDFDIPIQESHLNVAVNYYNQFRVIPDVNYIIAMVLQNQENQGNNHASANNIPAQNRNEIHISELLNSLINIESSQENTVIPIGILPEDDDEFQQPQEDSLLQVAEDSDNESIGDSTDTDNEEYEVEVHDVNNGTNIGTILEIGNSLLFLAENNDMLDVKKVLAENEVDKIKLVMIKQLNNLEGNKECPNCYDSFIEKDLVRILPCGHNFHRLCIDKQLKSESYLCPLCKEPAGDPEFINI